MKKTIFRSAMLLMTFFLITSSLHSQSPQGITYQAVMRNVDGSIMANALVNLTLMIHDGAASGPAVYEESQALTTNDQGLISCVVGQGSPVQGSFANIDWGNGFKFLHVLMNGVDIGTQQLMSVPFALHSNDVPVRVSETGDSLFVGIEVVIVPGISAANNVPIVVGCMDNAACNYNPQANMDDGSCLIEGVLCNDNNANTINDVITIDCVCAGTPPLFFQGSGVTDIDGNFYPSIIIGGQEWMQKNLAVTKYRNGNAITTGLSNTEWNNAQSGAYSSYPTSSTFNYSSYGKFYNWFAVNDVRGLCPTGWHTPSDAEWTMLETNLGGSNFAGGKMKTIEGWTSPNVEATNESGFTGFPGGLYVNNGSQVNGLSGYWWSNTSNGSLNPNTGQFIWTAWYRQLSNTSSGVYRNKTYRHYGYNVRCLRD